MKNTVLIRGDGVAASCCLHLLREAGLDARVQVAPRPSLPAIMLGETTQKLLRDVFHRDDLFAGFPEIRKRIVAWGSNGKAQVLPHSAVVASEKELLDRIQQGLAPAEELISGQAGWTIFASRPLPPASVEYPFGSRPAAASAVTLQPGCDPETCWIESLEDGWLFLLPAGPAAGWLISVGNSVHALLAASKVIQEQIADVSPARGIFPSHPRVAHPLSAPGWLACGTAALGFDPLCGDGTGNAVREAILGSAVIRAAASGGDASGLAAHYQARLIAGLQRHIVLCSDFYESGRSGDWWDHQLDELKRGLKWCSDRLAGSNASRYRLNGFALEPVE